MKESTLTFLSEADCEFTGVNKYPLHVLVIITTISQKYISFRIMDSDSEWEPPSKRRKLNNQTSKNKGKKSVQRKQKRRKRPKRKTRDTRNHNNIVIIDDESDESGIEILWDDNEYLTSISYRNNASNKNKNKNNNKNEKKSKIKYGKKRKLKKKKKKRQKQTRLNFKPASCAVTKISNLDALVCGYYRSFLSENESNKIAVPVDANIIFEFQKNIVSSC